MTNVQNYRARDQVTAALETMGTYVNRKAMRRALEAAAGVGK